MLKAKISSDSLLTAKRPNSAVFKTDLKRDHCVFLCVSGAVEDTAPHLCGNIWVNDSWAGDNAAQPEWSNPATNL